MIPTRLESRVREFEDFLRQDPIGADPSPGSEEVLERVTIDFKARTVRVERPATSQD